MTTTQSNLVTDNLALATSVAKQYTGRGIPLDDLIQEARIGLIRAATDFCEDIAKFSTYAMYWMRQRLSLVCRTNPDVTIPEYVFRYFPTIAKVRIILGPDATENEIVDYCNRKFPDRKVNPRDALAAERALSCGSLNLPAGEGERDTIGNLADHRSTVNMVDVREYLDVLSDCERKVITLRYGLDDGDTLTLQGIGEKINLTRERVRQIEVEAIKKMQAVG